MLRMGTPEIVVLGVTAAMLLVLVIVTGVLLRRTAPGREGKAATEGTTLLQQQLQALREETARALNDSTNAMNQRLADLDQRMSSTDRNISSRLDSARQTVENVHQRLGILSQATERVLEVGKDIASLQDILRAPKLRGIVGEYFLGDLLRQVVPANHELQHRFSSGEVVDAVVRLGPSLVPIDAKFPLEDFQRLSMESDEQSRSSLRRKFVASVKKHISAIASKYILPDEGTFDFALMYLPAENVYYETIIRTGPEDTGLSDYALGLKVIPVSPNSLYAYLQAIVLGLRGLRIEKQAEEILRHLGRLQHDHACFREDFDTLGTHLKNARNKHEDAAKKLDRLQDRLALSSELQVRQRESDRLPGGKE